MILLYRRRTLHGVECTWIITDTFTSKRHGHVINWLIKKKSHNKIIVQSFVKQSMPSFCPDLAVQSNYPGAPEMTTLVIIWFAPSLHSTWQDIFKSKHSRIFISAKDKMIINTFAIQPVPWERGCGCVPKNFKFFLLKLNIFRMFWSFWCADVKNNF